MFATLCFQLILNCWGESSLRHCRYLESDKVWATLVSLFFFHLMSNFKELKVLTVFEGSAVGGRTVEAYLPDIIFFFKGERDRDSFSGETLVGG